MNQWKNFSKGLLRENPILVLVLGTCPTLAVTTAAVNGIGMGAATTFVLVFSNLLISLLKNVIPDKVRIAAFILVIATFVTIVDLVMKAYTPDLYKALGIFIPLIVVNCIILGRAEAFACKNNLSRSFFDGLGMGVGFTLALILISAIREFLGSGQLLGHTLIKGFEPIFVFGMPSGALLVIGLLLGLFNLSKDKKA